MKKIIQKIKSTKAFTLLEMAIVLFIISVLLLLVIPNISTQRSAADKQGDKALKSVIETQVQLYEIEHGSRPASLSVLSPDYLNEDQVRKAEELGYGISN